MPTGGGSAFHAGAGIGRQPGLAAKHADRAAFPFQGLPANPASKVVVALDPEMGF